MFLTSWFRDRPSGSERPGAGRVRRENARPKPAARRRTPLLRLEVLEDRCLPSTLTVLNNSDSGAGSLRATIADAHNGDTIVFAPSLAGQTITLTRGELAITKSLDIEGLGAARLTVSGNDASRVFDIVKPGANVTIAGLTIAHGFAVQGGGIDNL